MGDVAPPAAAHGTSGIGRGRRDRGARRADAYAFERPADPYPELVSDGPLFSGAGLAHPLMPPGACVPNDLSLGGDRRLVLISGSNMSGKSTLLRTIGTNTVLALAGAPVRATQLTVSPLVLGTAMRFRDSVHEGASYFYAVLKRLRTVLDVVDNGRPLLFLFDEILQGTNSQDRLTGAEALIANCSTRAPSA